LDITIDITPETDIESWVIQIHFNKDVTSVSTPAADVTGRGKIWMLTSKSWSGSIPAGKTFELSLSITFENSEVPSLGEVLLNTETICGGKEQLYLYNLNYFTCSQHRGNIVFQAQHQRLLKPPQQQQHRSLPTHQIILRNIHMEMFLRRLSSFMKPRGLVLYHQAIG
jgi:hypothetical protein